MIVGVHDDAVIRIRVLRSTSEGQFAVESVLMTPGERCSSSSVREVAVSGDFPGGTGYDRRWRHEFEGGRAIRLHVDWKSSAPHTNAVVARRGARQEARAWPRLRGICTEGPRWQPLRGRLLTGCTARAPDGIEPLPEPE